MKEPLLDNNTAVGGWALYGAAVYGETLLTIEAEAGVSYRACLGLPGDFVDDLVLAFAVLRQQQAG